jgi:hypothetical protein
VFLIELYYIRNYTTVPISGMRTTPEFPFLLSVVPP